MLIADKVTYYLSRQEVLLLNNQPATVIEKSKEITDSEREQIESTLYEIFKKYFK